MVTTTSQPRQASIRKISCLPLLLAMLTGCQTHQQHPSHPPAIVGKQNITLPSALQKPLPPANLVIIPAPPLPPPPSEPVPVPGQNTPPPLVQHSPELPAQLANWRITRLAPREWRIAPIRRQNLSDSPPSLMADAIITSGIHARLQALPTLRATHWQYSSNAGNVLLSTPSLSSDQALSVLRAIVTLDKVTEIHLTTTLQ